MAKRLTETTAIGYAYWAPYLINGDSSGLDETAIADADKFAEYLGGNIVNCDESSMFETPEFPHNLPFGDCITYYALS